MRKLLALAAATLLAYGAAAQTTQGRIAVTGAAGYSNGSSSSDQEIDGRTQKNNGFSYTLSPSAGYFIKDNLEIGAGMHYEKQKSEWTTYYTHNHTHSTHKSKRDELRVYARQYKYLTERFALHTTLAGGIGTATQLDISDHLNQWHDHSYSSNHNKIRAITLSPGIAFFPADRLAISANLGALQYEHITSSNTSWYTYEGKLFPEHGDIRNGIKRNSFGFDFSSWNLNFGLSLFIGK